MIKISELNEAFNSTLLANNAVILPLSTGNVSSTYTTYKANLSTISNVIFLNPVIEVRLGNTGNVKLGNVTAITSAASPGDNRSRIIVQPSMDLNNSGSVNSTDTSNFNSFLAGTLGTDFPYFGPWVIQQSHNRSTGMVIANADYSLESTGSLPEYRTGQVYLMASNVGNGLKSYIRVGYSDYDETSLGLRSGSMYFGPLVSASTASNITMAANVSITGNLIMSGNINSDSSIISKKPIYLQGSEDLSDTAAANLSLTASYINTGATGETATLAAGIEGQIKTFMMASDGGGSMVITVTNPGWGGSGTITFNDAGDACILQYINNAWYALGVNGVAFG